ncbi:MAG: DNA mismatch endonuclease Vsr [Gemmatimonadetes bacterium]|nr:DNA mismatch endonuclease Vsr [Gemmatimonadota bacterium]
MTDTVDRDTRSRMMSGIRGKDTAPERAVRSGLHRRGLRFRLNVSGLPGRPDIVLSRWNAVVFVHGCFWHRHAGCRFSYTPKSRVAFWRQKFRENVVRDRRVVKELTADGWNVHMLWTCEITPARIARLAKAIRGKRS